MITVRTNISKVFKKLQADLNVLKDREYLLRPVATELIPMITERIHQKGIASDGSPIGTYSNNYLRLRENKYNRNSDNKVIISLTRQLENDWSVLATEKGYGIGFLNSFNAQKLKWVEEKKKVVSRLSEEETAYAIDRINELVNNAINS